MEPNNLQQVPPQAEPLKPELALHPAKRSYAWVIVLAILAVALGGLGMYSFYKSHQYSIVSTDSSDWNTYTSASFNFSIKYPSDWKIAYSNDAASDYGQAILKLVPKADASQCDSPDDLTTCSNLNQVFIISLRGALEGNDRVPPGTDRGWVVRQDFATPILQRLVYETDIGLDLVSANQEGEARLSDILSTFRFIELPKVTEESQNIGDLTGYYTQWNQYDTMCDALVVATGTPELVDYWTNYVKSGNTLNTILNGKLVFTLNLKEVPQLATQIKSSSQAKPITLTVQKLVQEGKGANPCQSFAKILEVK